MNSATIHINYMTPAAALHPNALYFDNDEETEATATGGTTTRGATGATGGTDTHHAAIVTGDTTVEHTALSSPRLGHRLPRSQPHDNYNHRGHTQAEASQVRASFATQLRHFGSDSCCSFRFGLALCRRRIGETRE